MGISTSLTRATLYRIAAGVTAIIALSTAVTYHLLYREIEQSALARLTDYGVQRARYHESHFAFLKGLHEVVRRDFVERYSAPPSPDFEHRFDELMSRYPDGAMRNSEKFSDVERYSTGWIHRRVQPDTEFKRRWMLFFDLSEKYKGTFTSQFANFYFMHPSQPSDMGYDDPERSGHVRWAYDTPADYALDQREYFYLADAAHNPERKTVWGGTYYEPAYKKILVPGVTPVYVGDEHIANIGTDEILDELEASIRQSDIAGATHTVFRGDGRLIIDPSYMVQISESFEGFNIRDAQDPRLNALLRLATESAELPRSGLAPEIDEYYAISRLPSTGWYFASTLPGALVRAQAFRSAQWVFWSGISSLAFLLLILTAILRRQIAQPLNRLLAATRSVASGQAPVANLGGRENPRNEIGQLANAFNHMVAKVSERDIAVRREKERFRALIEHAADIISVVDAEGIIRYVSPSVAAVLNLPPAHYVGRSIFEIVHPEDAAGVEHAYRAAIENPGAPIERLEYRVRHANGEWRVFEATGTNQLDNPSVEGIVVNARDITEAVKAEAEIARQRDTLYQREKLAAMGSLLAGVAHELNNPLSIVAGRAIMLEEEAGNETTVAAAGKIRAAAERCARIVKTFLAMARQHTPQHTAVRLNRVIEDSLEILSYSLRTGGVEVVTDLAKDLPEIAADADQLHQVFINLLINAQQALADQPEPRRLWIRSGHDPAANALWVEVADNGPGIPEAIRSRIFDPYFTTKPVGSGTGVGLAVSLGIVEAHGGSLSATCPPAGGAVFTVRLPVQAADAVEADTAAPEPPESGRGRILIVDDEPEVSALLADILASDRHGVDVAASGREALRLLGNNGGYAAILSDLRMPEMDGPALYREIERRWPELARKVIFVTGDSLSPNVQVFLDAARCPVIEKPFVPKDVRQKVAQVENGGGTIR
ncbi:ATP-binding protein [Methylocaldum gracile]|nr:PAS domain S-box protein [Methylocaldum sp. BRCS4]